MADTFYATLELKNIRMEGLLFSFLGKYEQNALFCDIIGGNKPMNFRPSVTLRIGRADRNHIDKGARLKSWSLMIGALDQ